MASGSTPNLSLVLGHLSLLTGLTQPRRQREEEHLSERPPSTEDDNGVSSDPQPGQPEPGAGRRSTLPLDGGSQAFPDNDQSVREAADADRQPDARRRQLGARRRQSAPPRIQGNTGLPDTTEDFDRFTSNLERRMRDRWAAERSVVANQVGSQTFADRRRAELEKVGGGYLAQMYGLRTAERRLPAEQRTGLKLDNDRSSPYQRSVPYMKMDSEGKLIYQEINKEQKRSDTLPARMIFVHSIPAGKRLQQRMSLDGKADYIEKMVSLVHGVVAVHLRATADTVEVQKAAAQVGATSSAYEVIRQLSRNSARTLRLNSSLRNDEVLNNLFGADVRRVFDALPPQHPMRPVATSAQRLVGGLQTTFAGNQDEAFRHNELVGGALGVLGDVVRASRTMTEDSARFFSAYQAMVDEIFLVLADRRPYDSADFKNAAVDELNRRTGNIIGTLGVADLSPCLVSSGMEAITLGLEVGRMLCNTSGTSYVSNSPRDRLPDYFEVPGLFEDRTDGAAQVFTAALNPSTPRQRSGSTENEAWNPRILCEQLKAKVEAVKATGGTTALVLDASVELPEAIGKSNLRYVLEEMSESIADGTLRIALCKSYQKYPSLASGKIRAGSVTIIGKDDPATQAAQSLLDENTDGLDWIQNEDSQLATHFIKYGGESELDLIGNAARNASFIAQHLLPSGTPAAFGRFQEELPFGVIDNVGRELQNSRGVNLLPLGELIAKLVEPRASFGFLETTSSQFSLNDVQVVRIAVGQDSPAELIERFYGLRRVLESLGTGEEGGASVPDATVFTAQADQLAGEAAETVLAKAAPEKWAEAALGIVRERAISSPAGESEEKEEGSAVGALVSHLKEIFERIVLCCGGQPDIDMDDAMLPSFDEQLPRVLQLAGQTADPQTVQAALEAEREVLRDVLRAELDRAAPRSKRSLAENLAIVGRAFAPVTAPVTKEQSDIDVIRATMTYDPPGLAAPDPSDANYQRYMRARYCSNMVAGILAAANSLFGFDHASDNGSEQRERSCAALLSAGAPGVSPGMRSRLLVDWMRLHSPSLNAVAGTEDKQTPAIENILRMARCTPHPEDRAKMLQSVPNSLFTELSGAGQRTLCEALFAPLDVVSRAEFIKTLLSAQQWEMADACISLAVATLNVPERPPLRPDQLGQVQTEENAPVAMDADQRNQARGDLLGALFPDRPKDIRRNFRNFISKYSENLCPDDVVREKIHNLASRCGEYRNHPTDRDQATRITELADEIPSPYTMVRDRVKLMVA